MAIYAPSHICDQGDCPAPASREVVMYGQDFSFCTHHARELEVQLEQRLAAVGRHDSAELAVMDGRLSELGSAVAYA